MLKGCVLLLFARMDVWIGCAVCFDLVVWAYGFGVAAYLYLAIF